MAQPTGNLAGTNQNSGLIGGAGDFFNNLKTQVGSVFPLLRQMGTTQSARDQATNTQNLLKNRIEQGNIQPGFANTPVGDVFGRAPGTISTPQGGKTGLVPVANAQTNMGNPGQSGVPTNINASNMSNNPPPIPNPTNAQLNASAANAGGVPGSGGLTPDQLAAANAADAARQAQNAGNTQGTQGTQTGQTATPPLNATVGGLLPGLLNTNNNPLLNKIVLQEQQQIGDTLTGQPGQPLDLAQGRAGLIQNTANAAIANALQEQQLQQNAYGTALGAVAPQTPSPFGVYQPGTNTFTQYGGGQGGGAATAGAVGTQVQQGASVQTMLGAQAQAQSLANNLGTLIDNADPNIFNRGNASVLTSFANGVAQWIDKQTGDPRYQNFANLINEISGKYASILNQAGGTPTDQSTLSHSIINSLAGGQDIKTILSNLDKNATDSINALKGVASGGSPSGYTGGAGNTQTSGGNTFGNFYSTK